MWATLWSGTAVKTPEGHKTWQNGARNRVSQRNSVSVLCRTLCLYQGRMLVNVRGKAMVSRTWSRPQIQATVRSTPRPKPLCTTEP